ncbi:MAG: bacillithiol biosynthesis deacetylase BshB1 [Gemmatimonadota bacterium]
MSTIDVLAIAPHPDDAELICGGTLARCAAQGYRTGILDLTAGEMASRGTPQLRAEEAVEAARILAVTVRETLGLPDSGLTNTPDTRREVALVLRRLRPKIVLAPAPAPFGRHPDHRITAELVRDAVFAAGLTKLDSTTEPHRPRHVLHAITFREDYLKPSFVVDITDSMDVKLAAVAAYRSQFAAVTQAGEVYPNGEPLADIIRHQSAHYGSLIRVRYGEPFFLTEAIPIDDIMTLGGSTF